MSGPSNYIKIILPVICILPDAPAFVASGDNPDFSLLEDTSFFFLFWYFRCNTHAFGNLVALLFFLQKQWFALLLFFDLLLLDINLLVD